uniref:Uncharacterized protein n=1 Tax=Anguilla anguilla TaxID=7936 RepID=A0A0E9S412_ANGAN
MLRGLLHSHMKSLQKGVQASACQC